MNLLIPSLYLEIFQYIKTVLNLLNNIDIEFITININNFKNIIDYILSVPELYLEIFHHLEIGYVKTIISIVNKDFW